MSKDEENKLIAKALGSQGIPEFCIAVDKRYTPQWFHYEIAWKLEEVVRRVEAGESPRLMIFMPPRHGKSELATQKFPAWCLGKHPDWPFVVSSYSAELAQDFGQNTRDLMNSEEYRLVFDTRLRADTQSKAKWLTQERGGYTAVGVGGTLTGRGFKIGIIDDPIKNREEADSETIRENVWKWYTSTFITREEGSGAIIVILTRWHDDDLAGRLLARAKEDPEADQWEILQFPALAEEDDDHRKIGDALWPEKFSRDKLLQRRASIGPYEFSSLYQQNPIDESNQTFKEVWFKSRPFSEVLQRRVRKFATIDPQFLRPEKRRKSDFTGVVRNYVNSDNEWNLKATRYKLNSKGLIDLIFRLHDEGFEAIGIEESAYTEAIAPFFEDAMKERNSFPRLVMLKHNQVQKETRIKGLVPRYETGSVYHIDDECVDLETELLRFPKAKNDDLSDATAYQSQLAEPAYEPQAGGLSIYS